MSLMRHHYPAKEETGRGEKVQLHGNRRLSYQPSHHAMTWESSIWDIMGKLNMQPQTTTNDQGREKTPKMHIVPRDITAPYCMWRSIGRRGYKFVCSPNADRTTPMQCLCAAAKLLP